MATSVWCPLLCCLISYFSTHDSHWVHFTLCSLGSGKDDAEELFDDDDESMYLFAAFFDLFFLGKLVDVDDSASDTGFFALFLDFFGEFVSGSVSGPNAS